jgi:hypothetical protein
VENVGTLLDVVDGKYHIELSIWHIKGLEENPAFILIPRTTSSIHKDSTQVRIPTITSPSLSASDFSFPCHVCSFARDLCL